MSTKVIIQQRSLDQVNAKANKLIFQSGVQPSGIQYQDLKACWSGQQTSFHIGDEGWRYQQGEFNTLNLANPIIIAQLDWSSLDPIRTLLNDNIFGNKNRFTDFEGLQNYPSENIGLTKPFHLIIDHLYGLAYLTPRNASLGGADYNLTFIQAVPFGAGLTIQGYTGFSVFTKPELNLIADFNGLDVYNKEPFNLVGGGAIVGSGTIRENFTNNFIGIIPANGLEFTARDVNAVTLFFWVKNIQSILQP